MSDEQGPSQTPDSTVEPVQQQVPEHADQPRTEQRTPVVDESQPPPKPVMQTRCVHCLREQWAPNVHGVSTGEDPCTWCGKHSEPMTRTQWMDTLKVRKLADEAERGYDPTKLRPRRPKD